SKQPIVESVKDDSSLVRLWYPIKVEVDTQKYYQEFAPRWFRILNQITLPDKGQILFQGHLLSRGDIEKVGYLPEERGLYKKMTVGEQAVYLAQLKGLSRAEAIQRLNYWFHKFEIEKWWNKKTEELSKGMQQKVQFIVTIIHEPAFLILDEPFSGFDPINANLLKT
ncbi:MAG: ATP-binding cassette domain-containing protein, partial [Bacteroidales bacterium]|nr:ATP-binding cassette domain-containing protein [Bacteroidales bacterium]